MTIASRSTCLLVAVTCLVLSPFCLTSEIKVLGDRATSGTLPITVDLNAHYAFARFDTELGPIHVQLYKSKTPLTVQNFLKYASEGDYDDTIIHRSMPGFVIQGGGFHVADDGTIPHIGVDAPVQNEPGISNLRGTVAMAKVGGNPDSATSEWFFNLADNSANLDAQNGGFTVFASVVDDGMDIVDQIAAIPWYTFAAPFSNIPLEGYTPGNYLTIANLVMIPSVREVGIESYSVSVGDSNLLSAQVEEGSLVLTPTGTKAGQTTVTVQVTTVDGVVVTETSTVHVVNDASPAVISAVPPQSAYEGLPFLLELPGDLILDDGPAEDLTYTALLEGGAALPAWLTFSTAQRRFSGTPPSSASGEQLMIELTATDGSGNSASTSFSLTTVAEGGFIAFRLESLWNLLCFPFQTTGADTPATVFLDVDGSALTTGSPFAWDPGSASYSPVSGQFVAKQAFWVFGPSATTWTKPILPDGVAVDGDLELVKGWNLVGMTQDLELNTLSDQTLSMLSFWRWGSAEQRFSRLQRGDTLRRGQGCWIGLFGADSYTLSLP